MANGEITVDTVNETVTVEFLDDRGEVTAAPQGAVATFTSDNEAVATVSPDSDNALVGKVSPVAEGTVNLGVTFNGTAKGPDGATDIPDPEPVALQVDPGAAVGARLQLAE